MKEEHQALEIKKVDSKGLVNVGGTLAGWYQNFFLAFRQEA